MLHIKDTSFYMSVRARVTHRCQYRVEKQWLIHGNKFVSYVYINVQIKITCKINLTLQLQRGFLDSTVLDMCNLHVQHA